MSQYVKEDDVATIAYMMGVESGKDYERAKIVAWLRDKGLTAVPHLARVTLKASADDIEDGEHLE